MFTWRATTRKVDTRPAIKAPLLGDGSASTWPPMIRFAGHRTRARRQPDRGRRSPRNSAAVHAHLTRQLPCRVSPSESTVRRNCVNARPSVTRFIRFVFFFVARPPRNPCKDPLSSGNWRRVGFGVVIPFITTRYIFHFSNRLKVRASNENLKFYPSTAATALSDENPFVKNLAYRTDCVFMKLIRFCASSLKNNIIEEKYDIIIITWIINLNVFEYSSYYVKHTRYLKLDA